MTVAPGGYVLKSCSLTFGGGEYTNQVSKARLVPDTPMQTKRVLVPDGTLQDIDSASWTFELGGIQDWTDAQGLARYLNDHAGEEVEVVFEPKSGGVVATFTIIATAVPFGGEQGNWVEIDLTFPVVGTPEFADPA